MSSLRNLFDQQGQSPWIDNLQRSHLRDGTLHRYISDGVRGLTSNPTIFQKAIQGGTEYDDQFASLVAARARTEDAYWSLVIQDIEDACDIFSDLHHKSGGIDGLVSVEVDPRLAAQADATVAQGRQLAKRVNRPNVMIKVPATRDGLTAVTELTAAGVSVNVTLIFSLERYRQVLDAYLQGLEKRLDLSEPIDAVNSVASFFISRVDSLVDSELAKMPDFQQLSGRTAINQAKLAYEHFVDVSSSARWRRLLDHGGRLQRPLWASTSTKNPAYRDTLYVDELIGPDTVNTLPENTLVAFSDHGHVARTVDIGLDTSRRELAEIEAAGVSLAAVARQLETEGVRSFETSFEDLLASLETKRQSICR
jgi:transaldolase